ncbi:MAG: MFS transporter [Candidatus Gracilibacteria bacterium]|nr:MFS transporter [bacterium]MDZ4216800.1 MFS transporter [Candidatus Gracilibacteria bacterium]
MSFLTATRHISPWQSFNEFFVSIVYFVQGAGGLVGIASSIILREQLGLDFMQIGLIGLAATLPWTIKPVFGLLTDLVPLGKFRRKPYLHIGPLLAFLGYLLLFLYGTSFETFFLALILANLGLSLTDVATDGFVVEESNENNASRIQGITQASIRIAAFVTSFFSGLLIFQEIVTPHQMYLILAFIPLITFISSFFITEKPVESITLRESVPEESITRESSLEHYQTKKLDIRIFTPAYISTLIIIFTLIITNTVFNAQIGEYLSTNVPWLNPSYISIAIWLLFGAWMLSYFNKLRKLKMTSKMIFIAILFILLWRINPGTGSSMFFYVKDTLGVNEGTLGYISTISQIGSILGVILAVKIFDKIKLKKLLFTTVIIAALFGLTSFAITRPEWAEWIGSTTPFTWLAHIIAVPVYFFDSLFQWIVTGEGWTNPITSAMNLMPVEKFLYLQSIIEELVFMIAYIPLLKFAVLITPKKAEATNYAIIASIMNIGLAISSWLSGWLYNGLMGIYHPELEVSAIQVDVIEILIAINIITSLTCLVVLPFLKTTEFEKISKE